MTTAPRPAGTPEDPQAQPAPDPAAPGREAEEAAGSDSGSDSAARVGADLDLLLADVKRERDEYLDLAQRARADFDNYRKRAERETAGAERRGKARIAGELAPALDNLERALKTAGIRLDEDGEDPAEPQSHEVSADEAFARGVELVYRELLASLERAGVERYDPAGESFDPAWHEALTTRSADGAESGIVLETVEKGYRLDGQVIRPARVVVSE